MKIRIMGTEAECLEMSRLFISQRDNPDIASVEISKLYSNRLPSKEYRLYVDIHYNKNCPYKQLKDR